MALRRDPDLTSNYAKAAWDLLCEAIDEHRPVAVYALFSGGHDSLATAALVARHPAFTACVHINTGIGIQETRWFVRDTCERHKWPLIERTPPDRTYDEMVMKDGFPGPSGHRYAYTWLKERALDKLVRETKKAHGDRVMLVTGVRRGESVRRMGTVKAVDRSGASVWVAPLIDWTAREVGEFLAIRGCRRNQVVDILHMSGECLCGAYAKRGELAAIAQWYPAVAERIADLQDAARAAGQPRCQWGSNEVVSPGQTALFTDTELRMCMCEKKIS